MTDGLSPPTPPRFTGTARLAGVLRAQRWMWTEAFALWLRRPLPSVAYARRSSRRRATTLAARPAPCLGVGDPPKRTTLTG